MMRWRFRRQTMKDKNKRRVPMLLNAQTVYHMKKEAEREGVSIGQIVDRMVREKQLEKKMSRLLPY